VGKGGGIGGSSDRGGKGGRDQNRRVTWKRGGRVTVKGGGEGDGEREWVRGGGSEREEGGGGWSKKSRG